MIWYLLSEEACTLTTRLSIAGVRIVGPRVRRRAGDVNGLKIELRRSRVFQLMVGTRIPDTVPIDAFRFPPQQEKGLKINPLRIQRVVTFIFWGPSIDELVPRIAQLPDLSQVNSLIHPFVQRVQAINLEA